MHDLNQFLAGAIFFGYFVIGLLFLRFWSRTGDGLFVWFAAAFVVFAAERAIWMWVVPADDHPGIYLTRLLAFALIAGGVINRNRRRMK